MNGSSLLLKSLWKFLQGDFRFSDPLQNHLKELSCAMESDMYREFKTPYTKCHGLGMEVEA